MPRPVPRLHTAASAFCLCILNTRNVNPNSCPWPLPFASHSEGTSFTSTISSSASAHARQPSFSTLVTTQLLFMLLPHATTCFPAFPTSRSAGKTENIVFTIFTHPAAECARFFSFREETEPKAKSNGSCWHFMLASMPFPCIPQLAII